MKFATLYKKTSTGAIHQWTISTNGNTITTVHGQVNGKMQTGEDVVNEGKNVGRANETSAIEQAEAEAKSKWEKQKKKGYVESISDAEAGEVDALIEGGVLPMLAFTFEKQGKKIKYPCFTQPKLDGIRMIAILKDGVCTLWSRTRKPITSLPHIIAEIEDRFVEDVVLDGEAYNHSFKDNFEHIVHIVRQEDPDAKCTDVEYHIYDLINDSPFDSRVKELNRLFNEAGTLSYLKQVETEIVNNELEVPDFFVKYKDLGYEGAMLRNTKGMYAGKRSADLIKVKEMQDAEFPIVGIEEGRGKLAGHVGSFICQLADGNTFNAKMSGNLERLKEYFNNPSMWKDQILTVQFQDLTAYGVPRFPVGLRIRKPE